MYLRKLYARPAGSNGKPEVSYKPAPKAKDPTHRDDGIILLPSSPDPCLLPPSVPDEHILNGKKQGQWFSILTRSVRLGSYKVLARESTLFTATGIQITIPDRFRGMIRQARAVAEYSR